MFLSDLKTELMEQEMILYFTYRKNSCAFRAGAFSRFPLVNLGSGPADGERHAADAELLLHLQRRQAAGEHDLRQCDGDLYLLRRRGSAPAGGGIRIKSIGTPKRSDVFFIFFRRSRSSGRSFW